MENKYKLITNIRVRYAETDKMGVAYNVNYLIWCEVARTELCRQLGIAYDYWEKNGVMMPVVESYIRHKRSAFYDDVIDLYCYISELKPHSIKFNYKLCRQGEDKPLAEGYTKHAFTDLQGNIIRHEHQFYIWTKEKLAE